MAAGGAAARDARALDALVSELVSELDVQCLIETRLLGRGRALAAWSPDGQALACVGASRVVYIVRAAGAEGGGGGVEERVVGQVIPPSPSRCVALEWSCDGASLCVVQDSSSVLVLWHRRSGQVELVDMGAKDLVCASWCTSPARASALALGTARGRVIVYDAAARSAVSWETGTRGAKAGAWRRVDFVRWLLLRAAGDEAGEQPGDAAAEPLLVYASDGSNLALATTGGELLEKVNLRARIVDVACVLAPPSALPPAGDGAGARSRASSSAAAAAAAAAAPARGLEVEAAPLLAVSAQLDDGSLVVYFASASELRAELALLRGQASASASPPPLSKPRSDTSGSLSAGDGVGHGGGGGGGAQGRKGRSASNSGGMQVTGGAEGESAAGGEGGAQGRQLLRLEFEEAYGRPIAHQWLGADLLLVGFSSGTLTAVAVREGGMATQLMGAERCRARFLRRGLQALAVDPAVAAAGVPSLLTLAAASKPDFLATCGEDNAVQLFDLARWRLVAFQRVPDALGKVDRVAFNAALQLLSATTDMGNVLCLSLPPDHPESLAAAASRVDAAAAAGATPGLWPVARALLAAPRLCASPAVLVSAYLACFGLLAALVSTWTRASPTALFGAAVATLLGA